MTYLRALMALFCFGTAACMIVGNLAHEWFSSDLMIQAYVIPVIIAGFGAFWAWWAWDEAG